MVWILQDDAMKPFTHFSIEITMVLEAAVNPLLMVWDLQEVALKRFTYFSKEILMVLKSPGSCLKSPAGCRGAVYTLFQRNIPVFKFPGSCCEAICALFQGNIDIVMRF